MLLIEEGGDSVMVSNDEISIDNLKKGNDLEWFSVEEKLLIN